MKLRAWMLIVFILGCGLILVAQQSTNTPANAAVPTLVNFSGTLTDVDGKLMTKLTGVTFYLYANQQGGSPQWLETQNVQPDKNGRYSVMLGSTSSQGLPADLFSSGEARWLGVQAQGQAEQPRVMLLSVPYALKAGDAATVGGLPPSAFVLAGPASSDSPGNGGNENTGSALAASVVSGSGTANFVPLWFSPSILSDSVLFQSGWGNTATMGINTTTPAATLDVNGGVIARGALQLYATGTATSGAGFNSQPFSLQGSSFNSGTAKAIGPLFQWQTEPSGNNTANPAGTLNLLYGDGSGSPGETGLNIASDGQITFATGQTFPGTGTGTVTNVATGLGLTGGPITTTGTLAIDTTKIPQLGAANIFAGNQSITGNLSTSGSVTAQTGNFDGTSSSPLLNIVQTGTGDGGVITATSGYAGLLVTGNSIGVQGTANASGGSGLAGYTTNGYGVYASDNATSGIGTGVFGGTASPLGIGVIGSQGSPASSTSAGAGVIGQTLSPTSFGVAGYEYASTGTTAGVYGTTYSSAGYAVVGVSQGVSGPGALFAGGPSSAASLFGGSGAIAMGGTDATSSGGAAGTGGAFLGGNSANAVPGVGVFGSGGIGPNPALNYVISGVLGVGPFPSNSTRTTNGPGVLGTDDTFSMTAARYAGKDVGIWGDSGAGSGIGVLATVDDGVALVAGNNSSNSAPVVGVNASTSNIAPFFVGLSDALNGEAIMGGAGCSGGSYVGFQLGQSGMSNCVDYTMLGDGANTFINAGNGTQTGSILFRVKNKFNPNAMSVNPDGSVSTGGNLSVGGTLSKKGGSFKIDHPLDPANKYLYHSFVESPDMMNIYNGVVALDGQGEAIVELPEYFGALNRDFRYQLTAIGAPGPNLYIAEEVQNNQFKIAGGAPDARVSWQVTGIRQDVWANAHRIPIEVDKDPQDRGRYLSPELYGQPATAGIGYGDPIPPEVHKNEGPFKARTVNRSAVPTTLRPLVPMRPAPPALPKAPALPKPPIAPTRQAAQASK
jgi:hypothetical protein